MDCKINTLCMHNVDFKNKQKTLLYIWNLPWLVNRFYINTIFMHNAYFKSDL